MSGDDVILRVENLKKYFPHDDSIFVRLNPLNEVEYVRAVDGVSFEIERGDVMGLVGESGCGKSTLARSILRLIEPTDGSIYFDGEDLVTKSDSELRAFRKKAQMIYQDPFASLNPRYTVRKTLVEPMKVHGIGGSKGERNQIATELIDRVGLDPQYLTRHPHEFSGGQRQRISIARALAVEPEVIVADEPTSALDVSVQANILNLLNDLKEERDLTLLFISHDLSVVRYISDQVSVMYLGELIETGDTDEVFNDPKHPYTESLLSSVPTTDPTDRIDFVPLKGEVPTPLNPPSGCRFHTRCPKIIPPEAWPDGQESWREFVNLKEEIKNGDVDATTIQEEAGGDREAYVDERFGQARSSETERTLLDALDRIGDDPDAAYGILDDAYESPCEIEPPGTISATGGGTVQCHLHDESMSDPHGGEREVVGRSSSRNP